MSSLRYDPLFQVSVITYILPDSKIVIVFCTIFRQLIPFNHKERVVCIGYVPIIGAVVGVVLLIVIVVVSYRCYR